MSTKKIEIDSHVYEGRLLAWGDDLAMLEKTIAPLAADPAATGQIIEKIQAGDHSVIASATVAALRSAPSLVMGWLDGWTRDGEPCTPESLAGTGLEPVIAAAHVAAAHGFFSPSRGLLDSALTLVPDFAELAKEFQAHLTEGREAGASESGEGTGSPASTG